MTTESTCKHSFTTFAWRTIATYTGSYFMCGLLFFNCFHYQELFGTEGTSALMKPTNSPIVALGPALQCIRGLLFAAVFYPFWNFILNHKHSVWLLWSLFLGLAILGACGAMPGSFEGMIYTIIPIKTQFLMLPEIVIQTLMFSAGLIVWYRYPRKWYNVMMIILLVAIVFMSTAGYIALSNGL